MPNKDSKSYEPSKSEKKSATYKLKCWRPKKKSSSSCDSDECRDIANASPETQELCSKFPYHFCIFVYMHSNEVDVKLYPFLRDEFKEVVSNAEIDEKVRQRLLRASPNDKRLKAIEAQTGCSVRLGKLNGIRSIIKGLPRRRLTIAGPSLLQIWRALALLEEYYPSLMQHASYPYRFPVEILNASHGNSEAVDHH